MRNNLFGEWLNELGYVHFLHGCIATKNNVFSSDNKMLPLLGVCDRYPSKYSGLLNNMIWTVWFHLHVDF